MLFNEMIVVQDEKPHGAAMNMALDEILLREALTPILRIYHWAQPAVSFGYFGMFDEVKALWPECEIVRRWTGGGIVPHGEDVTYTLIVPISSPFFRHAPVESYKFVHRYVATALQSELVKLVTSAGVKTSNACFENPVQHDVMADGRKVAGAAQRRTRFGLLHQGSVQPVHDPESFRERLTNVFAPVIHRQAVTAGQRAKAETLAAEKYARESWLRMR